MTIYIETQPRPHGWLAVITFDGNRKPVENVYTDRRAAVIKERTRRIDYWSSGIADIVTANAVPVRL